MNKLTSILLLLLPISIVLLSMKSYETQGDPWDIPEEYRTMQNPTSADDDECMDVGESLYDKHCKSCHGDEGFGDGKKAGEIDTEMPDVTTELFKKQAPGVKYYQSFIGRDDMPNFEKKIPSEEDRWCIINYMDTF
ncbi:MAG: cytochrome c [Saprospiraceae bacterium]|nr:cytochrome c [Saprospiraceae bacterium]